MAQVEPQPHLRPHPGPPGPERAGPPHHDRGDPAHGGPARRLLPPRGPGGPGRLPALRGLRLRARREPPPDPQGRRARGRGAGTADRTAGQQHPARLRHRPVRSGQGRTPASVHPPDHLRGARARRHRVRLLRGVPGDPQELPAPAGGPSRHHDQHDPGQQPHRVPPRTVPAAHQPAPRAVQRTPAPTGGTARQERRAAAEGHPAGQPEPGDRTPEPADPALQERPGGACPPAPGLLQVQVGVPGEHVARAAHAAQQPVDPGPPPGRQRRTEPDSQAGRVRPDHPQGGQRPPAPHRRDPRLVQGGGGPRRGAAQRGVHRPARRLRGGHLPTGHRGAGARVRGGRLTRHPRHPVDRRAASPADPAQPAVQRREVHTAGRGAAAHRARVGPGRRRPRHVRGGRGGHRVHRRRHRHRDRRGQTPGDLRAFHQGDGGTSRRFGGTGLGLSISRNFARLLGGEIRVQSVANQGSTFTLLLPVRLPEDAGERGEDVGGVDTVPALESAPGQASPGDAGSDGDYVMPAEDFDAALAALTDIGNEPLPSVPVLKPSEPAVAAEGGREDAPTERVEARTDPERRAVLSGQRVLIVDDDVRNVFALTSALEAQGLEVLYADNGRSGIAMLEANEDISLVLMDVMMPELDGNATTRAIRDMPQFADLPIISLTAKAMQGDRERSLAAGATDYVTKPVDLDHLLDVMRRWLTADPAETAAGAAADDAADGFGPDGAPESPSGHNGATDDDTRMDGGDQPNADTGDAGAAPTEDLE
ncbi:response regulator [Nocardiopsis sp. CNR-923]|uniref:response regulator n=1 Tax=Nocardiopsis sp. CNR-923 TaxID=1904965 RepID=UPI00373FDBF8